MKKIVLVKLEPVLTPYLQKLGLEWEDVASRSLCFSHSLCFCSSGREK